MSQTLRYAEFSDDRVYRYRLSRVWGEGQRATFIMLNPSTADEYVDDRTLGRCLAFAREWGLDGLNVVNLYAYRATDPRELWRAADPVGPDNDRYLRAAADDGSVLVAAWSALARLDRVREILSIPGFESLVCIARNKDGSPRHPLYAKGASALVPWPG